MADPTPLQAYIAVQRPLDAEMRRLLLGAAEEAEGIVLAGVGDSFTRLRAAQANRDLKRLLHQTFGNVQGITEAGIGRAARSAAASERWAGNVLRKRFGQGIPELERAIAYSAENGITALLAKQKNAIPLSTRVYHAEALSSGAVQDVISRSLLLQDGRQEIAKKIRQFISPNTPGGVSYAANRLARTEVNNAFHTQQIASRSEEPWTECFLWNISGSHKVPDECNRYGESVHFKGGEAGQFRTNDVPGKPHPNCLCYLTTVTIGEDEFVDAFLSGKYDKFMNEKLGEAEAPASSPSPVASLRSKAARYENISPTAMTEMHRKQKKWTPVQKDALREYTGANYVDINQELRKTGGKAVQNKAAIDAIDSAMYPVDRDIMVHRGVSEEAFGLPYRFKEEDLQKFVGQTIRDEGYLSTSIGDTAAYNTKQINLEIEVPKGTKVAYMKDVTYFDEEDEILLGRASNMEILSVNKVGRNMIVRARLVP